MVKTKTENMIEKPVWLKFTKEEVEAIILKLANKNISAEKIGLILRDQYGIPTVKLYGIKIKQVIESKKEFTEPTTANLKQKLDQIITHFKKNKQDKNAGRSLIITKAKLKKKKRVSRQKREKQRKKVNFKKIVPFL